MNTDGKHEDGNSAETAGNQRSVWKTLRPCVLDAVLAAGALTAAGFAVAGAMEKTGWNMRSGGYEDLSRSGVEEKNNPEKIDFLRKHLPENATCHLWSDPQKEARIDDICLECQVADIDYALYPITLTYGFDDFKSGADYILCPTSDYEDMKLYMVFFGLDECYEEIASSRKADMTLLKRK